MAPLSWMWMMCLALAFGLMKGVDARGIESKLIRHLLANYSRYGRPIQDITQPIQVSISFYLKQLMSLEEKHQILTTFGWMETYWHDDYLMWSPEDFGGLSQVVLSPELVWLPDYGVENSAKAIYDEMFFKRFRVSVQHDGEVNWVPGGKFVTSCQLDITYYPFDDQKCHIDLVDWAYHGLQVKLVNASHMVGLDAYTQSGEWDIVYTEATSSDNFYQSDPEVPFPRVRFTIFLRRKPLFYTINIITPCMTMSLLAILVFYLPPDSGEKVALGITVLLSFSVFLLLVAENVPKTSEFVPLLGIYLTLIMAMTAMSIVICVVVLNLHHRDPNRPVPGWLRHITYDVMAQIVCIREFRSSGAGNSAVPVYTLHDFANSYRRRESRDHHRQHNHHSTSTSCMEDSNGFNDQGNGLLRNKSDSTKKVVLGEILKNLKQITLKIKEREEQDSLKAEWKGVAKILDRFFLLLFVLLVFFASLVLLFIYPLTSKRLH